VAGRTQEALYAEIDLDLSWSEQQLPQVERTKHVHALHPYLGKYVPQLVETFLRRYFTPDDTVFDPFVGSGTTLVEANVYGAGSIGCDVSAFNCLLARVKTNCYSMPELQRSLEGALERARGCDGDVSGCSDWLRRWYAPRALQQLVAYRDAVERLEQPARDVGRVVLSRSARSARLTTHFDLDSPRAPQTEPYRCHKHKRVCRPVGEADKFLRRYTADTIRRLSSFAAHRTSATVTVLHGDARAAAPSSAFTGVITSPPYPGVIDYHEQHRYAYELLGLDDRRGEELGAAEQGRSRAAVRGYADGIVQVLVNCRSRLHGPGPVIIVVNDSRGLYPDILCRSGLHLADRLTRHVNRRTGRRSGEYFEDVLICTAGP
jgi:DNA methylase